MHIDILTPPEQRVLGCLIEKRFTTPDQYPLTLNALRLACNQSTNRDPVVDYDETTVRDAAQRLAKYGLTRLASGHSSRAAKFRHLAEDTLGVSQEQLALLCVLLLRGAQTPGELKQRSERMVHFESPAAVEQVLMELGERGYAMRLERQPGQKEERFVQLLGGTPEASTPAAWGTPAAGHLPGPAAAESDVEERLSTLEREVAALRAELRGERQADQVGGAADDHAGQRHLKAGRPPGAERHE